MTPSSNKTSPYQRFIPKEEVQEVSAWQFNAMDGSTEKPVEPVEEQALPPSSEEIEEIRQQAYAQGFEQGKLAGTKETRDALTAPLQQQASEQAAHLAQLLNHAKNELARLDDALATQVLELACDVARQVLRRELQQPLDAVRSVVQEALALAAEDSQPATLRLHPSDLDLLQADLGATLAEQHVRLVPDVTLTPGGCVVETPQGAVDGTLERRWARAVANLGLNRPWNPGEQADV
jgi:flagellar assembly protein FliH